MASPTPPPQTQLMFKTLQVALKTYMKQQEKMRSMAKSIQTLLENQPQMEERINTPMGRPSKPTYASKLAGSSAQRKPKKATVALKSAQAQAMQRKQSVRCDARTLCLRPTTEAQRLSSFSLLAVGNQIQDALRILMPQAFPNDRFIEDVRRNHKGLVFFQLSAPHFSQVVNFYSLSSSAMESDSHVLKMSTFGHWMVDLATTSQVHGMAPFVMSRVPLDVSLDEFTQEFCESNAPSLEMSTSELKDSIKAPRRLNRRLFEGGWTPSATICFYVTKQVEEKLLKSPTAIYGFNINTVTPYHQPQLRCLKCGVIGSHLAKDCRGKAKCRHCLGEHDTRLCPTLVPPASTSSVPPLNQGNDANPKRIYDSNVESNQSKAVRTNPGASRGTS